MIESKNYKYLSSINYKLKIIFEKNEHEFWDSSNPTKFNYNNTEFIDGFHEGEVTYLKIIKFMTDTNSLIKQYKDSSKIHQYYSGHINEFEIFNEK